MSKQHTNSKFDIEQILTVGEVIVVKKIIGVLISCLKEARVYDEIKKAPALYVVELKLYAEILLNTNEINTLISALYAFKELLRNENQKKALKQIIKKLEKERG